jgi:FkbM family methyltransferase
VTKGFKALKEGIRHLVYKVIKPPATECRLVSNSYAQAGEDRVMSFLFDSLGIVKPGYLDIGTNHPDAGNNTYIFYLMGSRGVCVEPDPKLCQEIREIRPGDRVINAVVGTNATSGVDLYVFEEGSLNTLSRQEAEYRESFGNLKVVKTMRVPSKTINEVISENFSSCPEIIAIDIEGVDLDVLSTFDFDKYRPIVFCVETIRYSENHVKEKITEIFEFMEQHDYFVYADTYINTLFVDRLQFLKHRPKT